MMMLVDLDRWYGSRVVDPHGDPVGVLVGEHARAHGDAAGLAVVRHDVLGRPRLVCVPLDGARVSPTELTVRYPLRQIHDAPTLGADADLPRGVVAAVLQFYGLAPATAGRGVSP